MLDEKSLIKVSEDLNIDIKNVKNVIEMLSGGSTIPFIARYRKEATGSLDEEQLRSIESVYNYSVNFNKRKESIKKLIDEKGMLTEELNNEIDKCEKLSELEDIYLPFKEKKKTKGTEAIKLGLEGLAKKIVEFNNIPEEELARPYLSDKVKTIDDAFVNAGYIIADWISDNAKYRKKIREMFEQDGVAKSVKKKNAEDEKKLYEIYYDFEESVQKIKSYRILAITRADKQGIVNYSIKVDNNKVIDYLIKEVIGNNQTIHGDRIISYIEDAYKRLIMPSIEREVKSELFDIASEEGIEEFKLNLESLLLTPPIKSMVVLGFDPAFRTGCKLAVISASGNVLKIDVIYPHEPKKLVEEAKAKVLKLIRDYNVGVIAIGNGTASRESEKFISDLIKNENLDTKYTIVSEAGASVYSASDLARKEFPDFSVEQRSAVSIARRLQDALSELVKIDPKSIGVGLYQHDLKQKELEENLSFVTSNIVNKVGVNVNTASESLLKYVSGLNKKIITKIIEYRNKKNEIKSREELKSVSGINDKIFEQCAGFLRILDGINPLDKTNIHPEDYEIVLKILNDNNIDINLVGTDVMKEKLSSIKWNAYNISEEKFNDIKQNLCEGIIDPRESAPEVKLRSDILTIDDLEKGICLEGTVRNLVPFGAFVDIGLHDDALLHISKISKDFLKHPSEILKVGDIITVYVDNVDKEKERVNLTMIEK